jgi:hypothetical protein
VENSLTILQKVNVELLYDPTVVLVYIPKRTENRDLHRYLHTNVCSSILHNSQLVGGNNPSVHQQMSRYTKCAMVIKWNIIKA